MSGSPGPTAIPEEARRRIESWRAADERLVFTNGVFDLLHPGHVEYLEAARLLGDRLIVGVNADASVRRIKSPSRPITPEAERLELLSALEAVDLAILFGEDTPERLIREIRPQVLAKGGDWALERIVGREFVESLGGKVVRIPLREGMSTTGLIEQIRAGRSVLE